MVAWWGSGECAAVRVLLAINAAQTDRRGRPRERSRVSVDVMCALARRRCWHARACACWSRLGKFGHRRFSRRRGRLNLTGLHAGSGVLCVALRQVASFPAAGIVAGYVVRARRAEPKSW